MAAITELVNSPEFEQSGDLKAMPDWKLMQGANEIGCLVNCTIDQPFIIGNFVPDSSFDKVRPVFDEANALLNAERLEERETAYDRIEAPGLHLVSSDGQQIIDEFLLHIEGDRAWFRY